MVKVRRDSEDPAGGKWTAQRILYRLLMGSRMRQNKVMYEFDIGGGRADLAVITPSMYVTEYEIKVSLADWNADRDKAKWASDHRKYIKHFFYAIPETLEKKIPDWLPPEAGIVMVSPGMNRWGGRKHDMLTTLRPCKPNPKAEKLPQIYIDIMERNCYYKYWDLKLKAIGESLYGRK